MYAAQGSNPSLADWRSICHSHVQAPLWTVWASRVPVLLAVGANPIPNPNPKRMLITQVLAVESFFRANLRFAVRHSLCRH